jgi:hypothetical protein
LDEPIECASGGDPLFLYKILHLLFFPLHYTTHYALRVEKNYQHGLDAGPLEFQFLQLSDCLTNPFRTLSLCFGVIGKTPGLISHCNFVKKISEELQSWECSKILLSFLMQFDGHF